MGASYDGPKVREARARGKERAEAMAALYREGWSLQQIGDEYRITRERVRQLLRKYTDTTRDDGGQAKAIAARRREREQRRDAKYLLKYGCTVSEYWATPKRAKQAFQMQRYNADRRGIGWRLKFWEWWTLWQASGRWKQRGRGQGYVMCRHGDTGPYEIGNVFIDLARRNNSIRKGIKPKLPMGVRFDSRGKRYYAQRMLNGEIHHLGSFPTPGAAHAAYLRAGQELLQEAS